FNLQSFLDLGHMRNAELCLVLLVVLWMHTKAFGSDKRVSLMLLFGARNDAKERMMRPYPTAYPSKFCYLD
ncbi:hypothetical protein U1Q18_007627, partial [Sarracenia purpurea var. burkii]